jgi:hypothetical protein
MIERRASSFDAIFPRIDAKNWDWAAELFEELGRPFAAQRARRLADEFRMLADRLDGVTPIGADEDAAGRNAA